VKDDEVQSKLKNKKAKCIGTCTKLPGTNKEKKIDPLRNTTERALKMREHYYEPNREGHGTTILQTLPKKKEKRLTERT